MLSFWTDAELPKGSAAGGMSGPDLQPATRSRVTARGIGNRRIWASGQSVSGLLGAPKMRLPRVHLQHTSSLK